MPDKEKYGHGRHGRRSIRLKDYDYSQQGAYFVTICTKNRQCLFGEIWPVECRLNQVRGINSADLVRTTKSLYRSRFRCFYIDAESPAWDYCVNRPGRRRGRACPARKGRSKRRPYIGGYRSDIQIHIRYPAEPTIISNGADLCGSAIITNISSEMKNR